MRPEAGRADYFDTPARAERLQLVAYLLRNAEDAVYLRGPAGAGKTRFAQRLAEAEGDVAGVVWLRAGQSNDLRAAFAAAAGVDAADLEPWPQALSELGGGRDWLLVVDDADSLDGATAAALGALPGGALRLFLLGEGGLDPAFGRGVQLVDMPPFTRQQTGQFLRLQAADQAERVTDDLVNGLHRAADGQPGPLLAALGDVLRRPAAPPPGLVPPSPLRYFGWSAAVLVLALALAGLLLYQDSINRWLEADVAARPPAPPLDTASQAAPPPLKPGAPAVSPGAEARAAAADQAPTPPLPPLPVVAAEPPQPVQGVDAGEDPLDSVMRDALAALEPDAAGSARAPEPPAEPPVAAPVTEPPTAAAPPSPAAEPARTGPPPPAVPSAPAPPAAPAASAQAPAPEPRPGPAEVVERGQPAAGRAAEPQPAARPEVAAAPPPAAVVESRPPAQGRAWLDSRPPGHYTLQLVGARERDSIERFVARHAIVPPYAVFERQLDGRPWYALVAGDYPDRDAALRARERLPAALRSRDIWPRTFGSIRELMQAR